MFGPAKGGNRLTNHTKQLREYAAKSTTFARSTRGANQWRNEISTCKSLVFALIHCELCYVKVATFQFARFWFRFEQFTAITDEMFTTFERLPMNDFAELTTGVLPWLEGHCKPHILQHIVNRTLQQIQQEVTMQSANSNPNSCSNSSTTSSNSSDKSNAINRGWNGEL